MNHKIKTAIVGLIIIGIELTVLVPIVIYFKAKRKIEK
jgi:hypothetical protein